MINKEFKHKYSPNFSCKVLEETLKGYKVRQTETYIGRKKPKITTAYYEKLWFEDKGIWIEK